jgi:hypothetical protein
LSKIFSTLLPSRFIISSPLFFSLFGQTTILFLRHLPYVTHSFFLSLRGNIRRKRRGKGKGGEREGEEEGHATAWF